jgi:hypothetical protein
MGIDIGHAYRFGMKKNAGAWGSAAVVLGAGDQFEANSESFKANVEKIMNNGIFGTPYRRGGSPGPIKPAGDLAVDLYYRDAIWRAIAAAFGADAVTALGGGAHRHDISIANAQQGVNWTLAAAGLEGVREIPCAKLPGVKLRWESEGEGSRGKVTVSIVGFDMNLNVGSPNASLVVATAAAANGVKTIAAQPTTPSPITLTITGVTELVTTIVYENLRGEQVTEVHTRSTGGLTYTTLQYCRPGGVISITCASIAGAGNFSAGVSNGVNNATTVAALTTDAERFPILFPQLEFFINEQEGADFLASGSIDEQYLSAFEIGLNGSMDQRVTTEFGYRISEPALGGAGWPTFSAAFSHSALTDKNRRHFWDSLGKRQLKAKAVFTGPPIAGASVPYSLTIWLNGLQVNEADPNVSGPGVIALEAPSEPSTVVAAPTGFPGGTTGPCLIQLVNTLATSYLA